MGSCHTCNGFRSPGDEVVEPHPTRETPFGHTAEQVAAARRAADAQRASVQEAEAASATSTLNSEWVQYGGETVEELIEDCTLIDAQYIVKLADEGGILPRWQELPDAARITRANVWRLGCAATTYFLPVMVLSYCWLDADHPDALGETLLRVKPVLKAMIEKVIELGGRHATVGVMWDFVSLPQRPRTQTEEERFSRGLKHINEWYRHPYSFVLAVTNALPTGKQYTNTRLYSERGWCYFELRISSLTKYGSCLLDFSKFDEGAHDNFDGMTIGMNSKRQAPMSPDEFAAEMRKDIASGRLAFTAKADAEFVINQYHKGFIAAYEGHTSIQKNGAFIHMTNLGWGSDEGYTLAQAISYIEEHCSPPEQLKLNLDGNDFGSDAMAAINEAARKHFKIA
mmetsp:Transcript_150709/g.365979  ORF Transcript_150709/g.365979 Transcript_150709/m.365979 type:complete len:398 (-) Transcript_150709:20-1213(-)